MNGLEILISNASGLPIYEQITTQIKQKILSGELAAGEALARPLGQIFVGYDEALLAMTVRAFRIYSFSFLLAGVAILGSSFFTALNDGLTSALISFARTLAFQIAAILILPVIWGIDGVWGAVIAAEALALLLSIACLMRNRKKYGYA